MYDVPNITVLSENDDKKVNLILPYLHIMLASLYISSHNNFISTNATEEDMLMVSMAKTSQPKKKDMHSVESYVILGSSILEDAKEIVLGHCESLLMVGCLVLCTATELLSMWNLTRVEVELCNMLSPEAPQLSLASYNWVLVFIAMLVDNFLYTISAVCSHFSQSINWSGIRYHLKDGKISKIDRSKDLGPKFTDLGGKNLYGRKGSPPKNLFISSLARSLAQWRQPKKYDI